MLTSEMNEVVRSTKRKKSNRKFPKEISTETLSSCNYQDTNDNQNNIKKCKLIGTSSRDSVNGKPVPKISLDLQIRKTAKTKNSELRESSEFELVDCKLLQKDEEFSTDPNVGQKKKKKNFQPTEDSVFESVDSKPNSSMAETNVKPSLNTQNVENSKKKNRKNKNKRRKIEFKASSASEKSSLNSAETVFRSEKAISYLETWKNNKSIWKFEKLTQFWLLKNMFDETMVPQATFNILLEYLINIKGKSKDFTVELCEGIIKKKEEITSSEDEDKILECAYQRARSILQYLQ